jgi:hypothetical protein
MKSLITMLLLTVGLAGCVAHSRVNANCDWTNDSASRLNLGRSGDVRHLLNDATVAEDLAIRYADATRGHRSGHFAGPDEYTSARERCLATLVNVAAVNHGVGVQQIRELRGRRSGAIDASVGLSFAVMYVLLSAVLAGGLYRRFPVDEPVAASTASLLVGIVLSICGVVALGLWAGMIEIARIGNAHLSYRADSLPWGHHTLALFIAGTFLFVGTAAIRYYHHGH